MMAAPTQDGTLELAAPESHAHHTRLALGDARDHLRKSALKLLGYVIAAYVVLRLVPTFEQALHNLEHVSWAWLVGAIALEVISETRWR